MTTGRRRAERAGPGRQRVLRHVTGTVVASLVAILVATAAWVFLVRAAIDFGRSALDGHGPAGWVFTIVAGAGATLCLMLVFVLLARMSDELAPKRPVGGHRRR